MKQVKQGLVITQSLPLLSLCYRFVFSHSEKVITPSSNNVYNDVQKDNYLINNQSNKFNQVISPLLDGKSHIDMLHYVFDQFDGKLNNYITIRKTTIESLYHKCQFRVWRSAGYFTPIFNKGEEEHWVNELFFVLRKTQCQLLKMIITNFFVQLFILTSKLKKKFVIYMNLYNKIDRNLVYTVL